jgi:hypothetical protein
MAGWKQGSPGRAKKRRPIGRRCVLSDGAESLSAPHFILKSLYPEFGVLLF